MTCDCDTRDPDPFDANGTQLQRCPHCPDCGAVGSYQGAGSTTHSNWTGKPYSRYYCPDCDRSYNLYAPSRVAPRT